MKLLVKGLLNKELGIIPVIIPCGECSQYVFRAVEFECPDAIICLSCLGKALALVQEAKNQGK